MALGNVGSQGAADRPGLADFGRWLSRRHMDTNSPSTQENAVLAPTVRIFAGVVLLVLFGGIALLVAPELIVTRWPWRLAPYAARFLGAIYTAEFVALVVLVIVNRWAPGRLTLVMAL